MRRGDLSSKELTYINLLQLRIALKYAFLPVYFNLCIERLKKEMLFLAKIKESYASKKGYQIEGLIEIMAKYFRWQGKASSLILGNFYKG